MAANALTQDDIDAIERSFRATLDDIVDGRFDDWLTRWTADARLMPSDLPDAVGHAQLAAWMRGWPAIKRFDIVDIDIEGSGDLAILICHFVRVIDEPGGGESRHSARQVLKFRREPDGQWLIAAAIFNAAPAG